jgi:hypothetical protein
MYANQKNGQAAAVTAAPTLHLGTLRRSILRLIVGNPLFTAQEQLLASHNIHECEDSAKLALWLKNVRRVAQERQVPANAPQCLTTYEAWVAAQPTTAPQPLTAPAATPAQCDEVYKLAGALPKMERADVLRRLPHLTEKEAAALILGLKLRKGPRLRIEVAGMQFTVAEHHYEAAKVDYVQEVGSSRVLPRYETLWGGSLVRRVWAN